jgi:hypothetical protein
MPKPFKPVTITVPDEHGNTINVTLTEQGVVYRRPRKRETFLLPHAAGETRAITLAAGIGQARTGGNNVKRGVLATGSGR